MHKVDWEKKRATTLQTVRRDSQGFDVLRDEESGFEFRRKRQKLPASTKTPSKTTSGKKSKELLSIAKRLRGVLSPILLQLTEEFLEKTKDDTQAELLRQTLSAFTSALLTPNAILTFARVNQSTSIQSCSSLSSIFARWAAFVGCDADDALRRVCPTAVTRFLEERQESKPDLRLKLQRLAPGETSLSTQMKGLRKKIASLKAEEDKWRIIEKDRWFEDVLSEAVVLEKSPRLMIEEDHVQIAKDKQKLILQSLEVQQSIAAAEEITKEAESLFRDMQTAYNHQEMAKVLVSDDPRVLIKNLLSL